MAKIAEKTGQEQDFHLVAFDRLLELPVVEFAINKSTNTYIWVKNSNLLAHWALVTAEMSLNLATKQAMIPIAVPIAKRLQKQINYVDDTLCRGLDRIEEMVPLVKETPQQILNEAYAYVLHNANLVMSNISAVYAIIIEQLEKLRDICWEKANEILDTRFGHELVKRIDNAADYLDALIEKYFPLDEKDDEKDKIDITPAEKDRLMHIIQTIGNLSTKATKHLYKYLMQLLNKFKDRSVKEVEPYIIRLVEFLHCTQYLSKANKTVQTQSEEKENKDLRNNHTHEERENKEQTDEEKKEK